MNVARLVASVGGYFYSTGVDAVAVHLYGDSTASLTLGGRAVRVIQKSDYPWDGRVRITVEPDGSLPLRFALKLRIPGWARGATLAVNGAACAPPRR
jgi:DUF1680 family protein